MYRILMMAAVVSLAAACRGTRTDFVLERSPSVDALVLMDTAKTVYFVKPDPKDEKTRLKTEIMAHHVKLHLKKMGFQVVDTPEQADFIINASRIIGYKKELYDYIEADSNVVDAKQSSGAARQIDHAGERAGVLRENVDKGSWLILKVIDHKNDNKCIWHGQVKFANDKFYNNDEYYYPLIYQLTDFIGKNKQTYRGMREIASDFPYEPPRVDE